MITYMYRGCPGKIQISLYICGAVRSIFTWHSLDSQRYKVSLRYKVSSLGQGKFRSDCPLVDLILFDEVPGSNPRRGIQLLCEQCFLANSLSLSPHYYLNMIQIQWTLVWKSRGLSEILHVSPYIKFAELRGK